MKGSGLIVLVLAALLVAMSVSAFAVGAGNGATGVSAVSMMGTKINVQEEVGGIRSAENMTALAVPPWSAIVVISITYLLSCGVLSAASFIPWQGKRKPFGTFLIIGTDERHPLRL